MNFPTYSITEFISQLPGEINLIQEELILITAFILLVLFSASKQLAKILSSFGLSILFCYLICSSIINFHTLTEPVQIFSGMLTVDRLGHFTQIIVFFSGLLAIWIYFLQKNGEFSPAYPILIVSILLGLDFLVISNHWAMIFLSLEIISLASYLLVSLEKKEEGAEAGIKYMLFGVSSSAIMLYGITWIYGTSNTLYLDGSATSIHLSGVIFTLIISGLLFKTTGFPFHFWAPDVYQGTSIQLLPFLSYAPKVGAFIILYKVTQTPLFVDSPWTLPLLSIIAISSLAIGNWGALKQDNTIRLMAYSGIAQTGLILSALCCGVLGFEAFIYYISIYLFMNFSSFYLLSLVYVRTGSFSAKSMIGLGQNAPFLGIMLLISLVALAGLPPTVGFPGKILIFSSLWDSYSQTGNLLFISLLTASGIFTLTSFFFYLKIPYYLFIKQGTSNQVIDLGLYEKAMALLLTLPLIILFFMPEQINNLVKLINLVV